MLHFGPPHFHGQALFRLRFELPNAPADMGGAAYIEARSDPSLRLGGVRADRPGHRRFPIVSSAARARRGFIDSGTSARLLQGAHESPALSSRSRPTLGPPRLSSGVDQRPKARSTCSRTVRRRSSPPPPTSAVAQPVNAISCNSRKSLLKARSSRLGRGSTARWHGVVRRGWNLHADGRRTRKQNPILLKPTQPSSWASTSPRGGVTSPGSSTGPRRSGSRR